MPKFRLLLLSCCLVTTLFLQGCAFQQLKVNAAAQQLTHGSPESALTELEKVQYPRRDEAQYLLNKGLLQHLLGDYVASTESLQSAKDLMESLQAKSVSENLAAAAVNETLRAYNGSPSERVLLHQILAFNYLAQGDLDGARVEILQADITIKDEADSDEENLNGQLASARFLAGIIYELGGEWSDAMIAYRKALNIMDARKQPIPSALQDGLLSMSHRIGLKNEYQTFKERFGRGAPSWAKNEGELIVFYWNGVVSSKQQEISAVFSPALQHHVSLALPYYPPKPYRTESLPLTTEQISSSTALLEDVELLAREDLSDEMAAITAMGLARMVAKHKVTKQAQENSPLLGFVANMTNLLTEVADVRSWNTLPSNIQVARLRLTEGRHLLRVGQGQVAINAQPSQDEVTIRAGRKTVWLGYSVSNKTISYVAR